MFNQIESLRLEARSKRCRLKINFNCKFCSLGICLQESISHTIAILRGTCALHSIFSVSRIFFYAILSVGIFTRPFVDTLRWLLHQTPLFRLLINTHCLPIIGVANPSKVRLTHQYWRFVNIINIALSTLEARV